MFCVAAWLRESEIEIDRERERERVREREREREIERDFNAISFVADSASIRSSLFHFMLSISLMSINCAKCST